MASETPERAPVQPARDRWCDLVMTGGIASGVVYPPAIAKLSQQYRFHGLGGTSAGAMAAALTAAAEYQRRLGSSAGFDLLAELPAKLGATRAAAGQPDFTPTPRDAGEVPTHGADPTAAPRSLWRRALGAFVGGLRRGLRQPDLVERQRAQAGQTRLVALLQARPDADGQPGTQRLMHLLLAAVDGGQGSPAALARAAPDRLARAVGEAYAGAVRPAIRGFWLGAALSLGAALALWLGLGAAGTGSALAALLLAATGLLLTALVFAWRFTGRLLAALHRDLAVGLVDNHFGLCTGRAGSQAEAAPPDDAQRHEPGLTDWLHEGIQGCAGRHREDLPLTFHDLWEAPTDGLPPSASGAPPSRGIDLRMVSSHLTQGRPIELPLADTPDNDCLFFDPREWARFFPARVMRHLEDVSAPWPGGAGMAERYPVAATPAGCEPPPARLLRMPRERMPLVVAARLSLSFPLLFSAVPGWTYDREARRFRRSHFSDGGLCANFPIHLFDAAVPRWPTFGILLDEPDAEFEPRGARASRVRLPQVHDGGQRELWDVLTRPQPAGQGLSALLNFGAALVNTARRWQDFQHVRMPGARERIVRVTLGPGEGELNLTMSGATLQGVAEDYGRAAAEQLLARYAPAEGGTPEAGWDEHRWIRWHTFVLGLRERLQGLGQAAQDAPGATPLAEAIERARHHPPLQRRPARCEPDTDAQGRPDPESAALPPFDEDWLAWVRGEAAGRPCPPGPEDALDDEQRAALAAALDLLVALEQSFALRWREPPYQPQPRPRLAVRPPM
jgi:predicted acylesterase/phospholipase RssA